MRGGTVAHVEGDAALGAAATVAFVVCACNWWSRRPGAGDATSRRVEAASKPLATLALAALAIVAATVGGADAPTGALVAALVGFALCLGGDVALLPFVDRFVVGLASFLAGHVAFVVMFVLLGLDRPELAVVAIALVSALVLTAGRRIVDGARRESTALRRPVQTYLAVISSMAVVGFATGRPAAVVGSALFVASDAILGWNKFVRQRRWMPIGVMTTYHGALAGLAWSLR